MKNARFLLLLFTLMFLVSCREATKETALMLYEQALEANAHDSIRQSEQLLHRAIRTAKAEGDHHTLYLSQLQLAQSLSWGNADAALDMARQALDTYKQHPDKARNHIIILDYIATYASQRAYNNDTSFDEALRYAQEAHRLSKAEGDSTLVSQTLTTLANIYWAMEQYPQALTHAREATRLAPPDLLLGAQQVLGRCLVSCDSLSEAENVYRHMDYGDDIQAAYIVESNLAKLALRRNDAEAAETAIDEAFERAETLYFKALGQKDDYYQASLRQDRENERLRYRQRLQGILLAGGLPSGSRDPARTTAPARCFRRFSEGHHLPALRGRAEALYPSRPPHRAHRQGMGGGGAHARHHRQRPSYPSARGIPRYEGRRRATLYPYSFATYQPHHRQRLCYQHLCRAAPQTETEERGLWGERSRHHTRTGTGKDINDKNIQL